MQRWQVAMRHKTTGARRTILYSKFLMSVHCGRLLGRDEEVDHLDGNRLNDTIENLEVVTRRENLARQAANRTRSMVVLTCPRCQKEFARERRQTHIVKGGNPSCCSRHCGSKVRA